MSPTLSTFFIAVLGSTLAATIVGFFLSWWKESRQKRLEMEELQFEELYGSLTYHLLAMKVLTDNKNELIKEIQTEPGNIQMKNSALGQEPRPLIERWQSHRGQIETILACNSGYIKKEHIKLVEDFLDACVKWEIAQGGQSHRATQERMDKLSVAVANFQKELLS